MASSIGARRAGGRAGIERIVLVLHRSALARVGPSGEALDDEATCAGRPCGGDEVVGAFGAQPVGEREVAVDAPDVQSSRDRGELVDDDIRARADHRVVDR